MTTPDDELKTEAAGDDLRATNVRLLRQLDKAKAYRKELVNAVYRAALDAASSIIIPPVPKPVIGKSTKAPEVAICLLADWQSGKITPDYNSDGEQREQCDLFGRRGPAGIGRSAGRPCHSRPVRDAAPTRMSMTTAVMRMIPMTPMIAFLPVARGRRGSAVAGVCVT